MRERYIPAMIMLIAGAITSIANIVNKVEMVEGLKRLLIVLVVFYLMGLIIKAIIKKTMLNNKNEAETSSDEKAEQDNPDDQDKQL